MDNLNFNLESLKKLNSNETANISDVIVNVITLINITATLIAVIYEKTGNIVISDLFYNISNFLIIFAITISLILKMIFEKKSKDENKKSKNKKSLNKTEKIINELDIKNFNKIKKYNVLFFIILIINIIIAILDVTFEQTKHIFLSDIFYDINSYIIIGIIIPVLIYGLILKYKIKKQNSSLLNKILKKIFENADKNKLKKLKNSSTKKSKKKK